MTIEQVINYFKDKEDVPCPLTKRLVGAGYQQKNGGYIKRAQKEGLEIDYTKNSPSQYWHLMTFCYSRPPQEKFTRTIQCGELIFWMAEASGSVPSDALEKMVDAITNGAIGYNGDRPIYDRRHWNKDIQRLCFDAINAAVEKTIINLLKNHKMKLFKEYPATHSMSTSWFAIDDEGKVAILNFEDNGPIPQPASGSQTCAESLVVDGIDDSFGFKYREYSDEQALAMFQNDPEGLKELFGADDRYYWGYLQIDTSKTDEFIKIIEPMLQDKYCSIACYSRSLGIFSFSIDKSDKTHAAVLENLKSSDCVINSLKGNFDYDFIDDEEGHQMLSPIPFVVYNQEYGCLFGDLNKVYSPDIPQFTEDQLTDYERAVAIRVKGQFANLAHLQPAAHYPFDAHEYLDRVDVDGQPYYKMRLTGNTDQEAYVYDSLSSGLKTDTTYCEKCPLYDKQRRAFCGNYVRGWEMGNHPTVATIGSFNILKIQPKLALKSFDTDVIQCGFDGFINEHNKKRAEEVGMDNILRYCKRYFEDVLKIFHPYVIIMDSFNRDLLVRVYPHTESEIEIDGEHYPYFVAEHIEENLEQIMELANKPYRGKDIPKILSVDEAERIGVKVER